MLCFVVKHLWTETKGETQRVIPSRHDIAILPAWVAGQSACRILFILLAHEASHIIKKMLH